MQRKTDLLFKSNMLLSKYPSIEIQMKSITAKSMSKITCALKFSFIRKVRTSPFIYIHLEALRQYSDK